MGSASWNSKEWQKFNRELGERLEISRRDKGVTASKVSYDTGVSKNSIGRYESGVSFPTAKNLRILAEYYNASPSWLLDYEADWEE